MPGRQILSVLIQKVSKEIKAVSTSLNFSCDSPLDSKLVDRVALSSNMESNLDFLATEIFNAHYLRPLTY